MWQLFLYGAAEEKKKNQWQNQGCEIWHMFHTILTREYADKESIWARKQLDPPYWP